MGRSWAKVSVVAIALAALAGCSSDPEPSDAQDDGRLHCNLVPNDGFYVTVKGTAQYTTEVTGDAVVDGISYSAGDGRRFTPKIPSSRSRRPWSWKLASISRARPAGAC